MDPADFQRVLDVNLTGVFNCTQAVVPQMLTKGPEKSLIRLQLVAYTVTLAKQIMLLQRRQSLE